MPKPMIRDTPIPTPILILGMHRSGTSCLTGCLEEAGLALGDVNTQAGFNKKGNRENRAIMDLHDTVLSRVGASWDRPPVQAVDWTEPELDALNALISTYPKDGLWGIKDPRTLLLLKGWMQVTQPRFVGTFRHPNEVAASLMARAQAWKRPISMDTALELWRIYNQCLLALYAQDPFDIIRYDISPDLYQKNLTHIMNRLGLCRPQNLEFREADLHNHHTQAAVPDHLKTIWEALNAIAL